MTKTKLGIAIFCGIFCLAFLVGRAIEVKAEGPVISDLQISVSLNSVYLIWSTDVATTAKIEYGKTSGQYTESKTISESKTSFGENIGGLDYETTYYFRITATDSQNNSQTSDEISIKTSSKELKFVSIEPKSIGSDKVVIEVKTNKAAWGDCKYGSSADNLDKTCGQLDLLAGAGGDDSLFKVLNNLEPETTYYYQITSSRFSNWYNAPDESITSEVKSVKTTGIAIIENISPESGPVGTELTINGKNFGNETDFDWMGRTVAIGCMSEPSNLWPMWSDCGIDIISWSNDQIKAKVTNKAKTGPVYVGKSVERGLEAVMFSIKGPTFTVTTGTAPTTEVSYVNEAYGCKYSTTTKDTNTVQVKTLFTQGSETDTFFKNVYEAYYEAWSRYPRCDELQFHYDHSTPLETLKNWLANYSITEKYGCKYSTTVSDENTVRLDSLFILESDMDKYLNNVYKAYYETWGRYPRCDELEFHATHNTPLDRLKTWLKENTPKEETTEITGKKIEFKDSGENIVLKDSSQDLNFTEEDQITFSGITEPNSLVILTVSSEPAVYTTKSDSGGNWAYTLPGPLEIGEHTVKVSVLDENGEKVRESDSIAFTVKKATTITKVKEAVEENITLGLALLIVLAALILILFFVLLGKKKRTS